ncbi:MAG: hypothetical protein COW01_06640 [Bdellovibrionales bacterium CG12_big_fil_rev_8_21_14_0_65_38_15]|nr:MAG: hypothetical protein COW79_13320 [Bdellovibrionales bacterium CG22_combo_CG10-13_8_21_14_all_38_13]PIQ55648.1 MAG: hypothetical protein COW01_06640 [Bdellovibrionales bacterium CG12_big_fil_rev_8_21_14_0_65_38_15]PIR30658.1 MAG: hypothetical protein COV38_03950 [Bdellovibrionales bacterium CG11_big_fil_rev_8_21_14_0_20_38_13]
MPRRNLLLILSFLWLSTLFVLGGWWVYLMIQLGHVMEAAVSPGFVRMVKWEGGTFLLLLILLSVSLMIMWYQDQRKTKSIQAFFASLTHELKTPLASIRLQSEVIDELVSKVENTRLHDLTGRLIEDTQKLEDQMDKILQLSRIERGGNLNPKAIELTSFVKTTLDRWGQRIEIDYQDEEQLPGVMADQFALMLVLRNLLENTRSHATTKRAKITITSQMGVVQLTYQDDGFFDGDINRLGTLFYKHNSTKGSGIGLYLAKKLMLKMDGKLSIKHQNGALVFELTFKSASEVEAE